MNRLAPHVLLASPVLRALPVVIVCLALAACGSDGSDSSEAAPPADAAETDAATEATEAESSAAEAGVRLVSASDGAAVLDDPPADLVVLDVRTAEEFAEARLDGATMLDFYRDDFADQLAELDRDVPYLLYCRSGNRSGQTAAMMKTLGFSDVVEVDGGIQSWNAASLPTVSG